MKHIFLHGLGQTPDSWQDTLHALKTDIDAACPDLFGLLRDRSVTYEHLYQAFSLYCGGFSEPLCLCGLSLGGVLALQYAAQRPDRVRSMVLIGTQFAMPKKLLRFQNALFRVMPNSSFAGMGAAKGDIISLTGSMLELNLEAALPQITCPVLVACGERDRANLRAAEELDRRLPSSELVLLPGAGHELNRQAPVLLARALDRFFEKHTA